jgi:hypothetical protein
MVKCGPASRIDMASSAIRTTGPRIAWVAIGLAVGIVVGGFVGPLFVGWLHPSSSSGAQDYPLWCSDPNPQTDWKYYATYYTSNGTIAAFVGGNGTGLPIPTLGEAVLAIGTSSYSNQTLIHSMYCYVGQGHTGGFPFHVDISSKEVVWA